MKRLYMPTPKNTSHCFDTVIWATGRAFSCKKSHTLSHLKSDV